MDFESEERSHLKDERWKDERWKETFKSFLL
jgi:hypothetical protein